MRQIVSSIMLIVVVLLYPCKAISQLPFFDDPGYSNPQREYLNQAFNERIDPFTGNVILSYTDVFLPGNGGLDLKIQRTYNSKIYREYGQIGKILIPDSWVGLGWSLHMGRLVFPNTAAFKPVVEMPDGSQYQMYLYSENTAKQICFKRWIGEYVSENNAIVYRLTLTDGTKYTFKDMGVVLEIGRPLWPVTKIESANGNTIQITYEIASGQIFMKSIVDSEGKTISFKYNANTENKELESIQVDDRIWRYYYKDIAEVGRSLLVEVKPPAGPSWYYEYKESGWPEFEIKKVTYPSGGFINYTFGDENIVISGSSVNYRVVKTRTTGGIAITPGAWQYEYDYGNENIGKTTVSGPSGVTEKHYFYGAGYAANIGNMWRIGLQTRKEILKNNIVVEETTYEWDNSLFISDEDRFSPPFIGVDDRIYVPAIKKVNIKRGSRNYSTTYSNFDNRGNPGTIVETGQKSRTTSRLYDNSALLLGKNLISLVKKETSSGAASTFEVNYEYDNRGNVLSVDKYGIKTTYTYFPNGNLASEIDANNNTIKYSDYKNGSAQKIENPEYSTQKTITWWGTVEWQKDGKGNVTTFEYDHLNRITKIDFPGTEANIVLEYAANGRWARMTQGAYWAQYSFDGFGRLTDTENSVGVKSKITFNEIGHKTFQSYPYSSVLVGDNYTFDALGRVEKITHPDGKAIEYTYDDSQNKITIKNENLISTAYTYESYGSPQEKLLIEVDDPIAATGYQYNVLGSLTLINAPGGITRKFTYNAKNLLISQEHPESGKTSYSYDAIGNLLTKTDANGNTTKYVYDGINRLIKMDYPTGTDVSFVFDGADNLIEMTDMSGKSVFQYSPTNRLLSKSYTLDGHAFQILYDYDSRGNMVGITYPSGRHLTYKRDAGNRLTAIDGMVSVFEYHPSGKVQRVVYANGVETNFGYDENRYWLRSTHASNNVLNIHYSFDAAGNLTQLKDNLNASNNKNYSYDAIERLTVANGPWGGGTYAYNATGNRISKKTGSVTTNYSYGNKNRLASTSSGASNEVFDFTYDDNGNALGNGYQTFKYSYENQIVSVDNGNTAVYVYDGQKRRVKKTAAGGIVKYYHFDQNGDILAESDANGKMIQELVYGNKKLLASIRPSTISTQEQKPDTGFDLQVRPNPSDGLVTLSYRLIAGAQKAVLNVYSSSGAVVRIIKNIPCLEGENQFVWDGFSENGMPLPAGIYFLSVEIDFHNKIYEERVSVSLIR